MKRYAAEEMRLTADQQERDARWYENRNLGKSARKATEVAAQLRQAASDLDLLRRLVEIEARDENATDINEQPWSNGYDSGWNECRKAVLSLVSDGTKP